MDEETNKGGKEDSSDIPTPFKQEGDRGNSDNSERRGTTDKRGKIWCDQQHCIRSVAE